MKDERSGERWGARVRANGKKVDVLKRCFTSRGYGLTIIRENTMMMFFSSSKQVARLQYTYLRCRCVRFVRLI
jgi:hypothetical protein